jgi:hypothetical protein
MDTDRAQLSAMAKQTKAVLETDRLDVAADRGCFSIKSWMGSIHFQMKTLKRVGTEMTLHVLAYNLKRVMNIIGINPLIAAIRA